MVFLRTRTFFHGGRCVPAALFAVGWTMACVQSLPQSQEFNATEVAEVRQVLRRWNAAAASGEVEELMSVFAEDAVIMPANRGSIAGIEEIRKWEEAYAEGFHTRVENTIGEVVVSGDWAFCRLTMTGEFVSKAGGEPLTIDGKALVILQRQLTGEWRIARLIGNSNKAPQRQVENVP